MSKIDMRRDNEKRFRSKLNRKHWRDYRLRELEKQLEFAESRCGTLKQQLDYIKVLYGCGKPSLHEAEDVSECYDKEESQGLATGIRISLDDLSRWNALAGDYAGGGGESAQKCFLPGTMSYTNTTRASTNSSNKPISSKSSFEKKEIIMNEEDKEGGTQKGRSKVAKGKRKKLASSSRHKLKNKGTEPRFNNAVCQTLWPMWQDPVVEIYKNAAANIESESAADITYKNKRQKLETLKSDPSRTNAFYNGGSNGNFGSKGKRYSESNEQLIPATKLKAFTSFKSLEKVPVLKEEGVQTDAIPENAPPSSAKNEPRTPSADTIGKSMAKLESNYNDAEPVKSYCQPTISSKKKRVERNFLASLNNLNLRNIPFIAATSTAPSHNIGVNIQQVLSIMKKRQPAANNDIFPMVSDHVLEISQAPPPASRQAANEVTELVSIRDNLCSDLAAIDSKKRLEGSKSSVSERKMSEKGLTSKMKSQEELPDDGDNPDWICKVHKLKKVLVFLHEDFTSLSQKYKRLQKKLSKRNINKVDAKGELAEIERDLEKKEEEITIVIGLYKEVLHLRDEVKKYQEKYNFVVYERALMMDGIKQSSSTHAQMSTLLRKIQQFQDQLKR